MAGSIALRHHMPNIRSIYRRRFQRARICAIPRPHLVKYCCNPRFSTTTSNVRLVVTRVLLSHTQHDAIQCPNGKDEPSVSILREHAISFNHELGRTIIILNWDPKTDPAASVAIKREDRSR
jgi:hypothetical protein